MSSNIATIGLDDGQTIPMPLRDGAVVRLIRRCEITRRVLADVDGVRVVFSCEMWDGMFGKKPEGGR